MEPKEEQKKMQFTAEELVNTIEAILFWKGEPMSSKDLVKATETSTEAVQDALTTLRTRLCHGVVLQELDGEYSLVTAPQAARAIERLAKSEMSRDLGKAGLETLSIILYKGPSTRADIDYIRGVSSQFILRNLALRGLIEKVTNPQDSRSYIYKPTPQLLSHLGLASLADLPEAGTLTKELESALESALDEDPLSTENSLTDDADHEQSSDPINP